MCVCSRYRENKSTHDCYNVISRQLALRSFRSFKPHYYTGVMNHYSTVECLYSLIYVCVSVRVYLYDLSLMCACVLCSIIAWCNLHVTHVHAHLTYAKRIHTDSTAQLSQIATSSSWKGTTLRYFIQISLAILQYIYSVFLSLCCFQHIQLHYPKLLIKSFFFSLS